MIKKLLILIVCGCTFLVTAFYSIKKVNLEWYVNGNFTYQRNYDDTITLIKYQESEKVTEINIPGFLDGFRVSTIGKKCFDCTYFEKIKIPDTIDDIEKHSFYHCDNVTTISIPTHIDTEDSFDDLYNLNELIITYGKDGFMKNYNPGSNRLWDESKFSISSIVISDGIRYLSDYAFINIRNLESVSLPETIESIGNFTFYNDVNIKFINLPYGLKSIGDNCFQGSSESYLQTYITLPSSISYIGKSALSSHYLYYVYQDSPMQKYCEENQIYYETIDLTINEDIQNIKLGDTIQTTIPEFPNGFNDDVYYESSNLDVAIINELGYIQTLATGTSQISIYTTTGRRTIDINVEYDCEAKYCALQRNESFTIDLSQYKTFINNLSDSFTYSSSDENVVSVSQTGVVTAHNSGNAIINIQDNNDNIVSYLCRVFAKVENITLSTTALTLKKGSSYTISKTISPKKVDNSTLSYESSNPKIAKVNSKGKISAIADGTCEITVRATDGSGTYATMSIVVSSLTINIDTDAVALMTNKAFQLNVSVSSKTNLTYSSSNESIATVSNTGEIIGKKAGTCIITISDVAKCAYATVEVKVYNAYSYGIDISRWNGTNLTKNNFIMAKDFGIDFVYIRAGNTFEMDTRFESNYWNAKAASLDVGAYHYTKATTVEGMIKEANLMIEWCKGKQFEYPIMLDIEANVYNNYSSAYWNKLVEAYLNVLEDAGYKCIVYSYSAMLNKNNGNYDCWVAQWNCTTPDYYKKTFTMWQFSDVGRVNGFNGVVDMNICFYDYPSYIKRNHLNGY